jgi:hypothetical protein
LAPALSAQAPRFTVNKTLGATQVTLEYGAPPWNEDRFAQLESQLPIDGMWRAGAEDPTTIVLAGAPVLIGGNLMYPGTYTLNLRRTGEKQFDFAMFEGAAFFSNQETTDSPSETEWANAKVVDALNYRFTQVGRSEVLELSFGPIRVRTPVSPVQKLISNSTFNGNRASITWYSCKLPKTTDLQKPLLAAEIDMEVGEEDCPMRLYLSVIDGKATAVFRNADCEDYQNGIITAQAGMEQIKQQASQQGGDAESTPQYKQLRRSILKAEMMLEDLQTMPDKLTFAAAATDAADGSQLSAKLSRKGGACTLTVQIGTKTAVIPIDESRFKLSGS